MKTIVAALSWIFFMLFILSSFINAEDYLSDHEKNVKENIKKNSRSINFITEKCDSNLAKL